MSGGYFDYKQYQINDFAEEVKSLILNIGNRYSKKTVKKFIEGYQILEEAAVYAQRIDWLISGDDGEESFHERLGNDLAEIPKEIQVLSEYVKRISKNKKKKIEDYDEYFKLQEIRYFLMNQGKRIGYCGDNVRVSDGNKHFFIKQVYYSIDLKAHILVNIKSTSVTKIDREKMKFCLSVYGKKKLEWEMAPVGIFITPGSCEIPKVEYIYEEIPQEDFESKYLPMLPEYTNFPKVFERKLTPYWK